MQTGVPSSPAGLQRLAKNIVKPISELLDDQREFIERHKHWMETRMGRFEHILKKIDSQHEQIDRDIKNVHDSHDFIFKKLVDFMEAFRSSIPEVFCVNVINSASSASN